jgi:hypothetical protein
MASSKFSRFAAMAVVLLLVSGALLPAQEQQPAKPAKPEKPLSVYTLGQQVFSISLGLFVPLFFQDFQGALTDTTNLALGGFGSLQWGVHLDNHWLVGAEVGGIFSQSLHEDFLYMLPITAKAAYIFHIDPFEIPVFLGAGMDIVKYAAQSHIDFILKPGFSALWKYNLNWGFGLNVAYWWVPQPWRPDPSKALIGNFLEVSATAQYNF